MNRGFPALQKLKYKRMKKAILLTVLWFAALPLVFAGDKVITGRILDSSDHTPLVGASVAVPSAELKRVGHSAAALGVQTDVEGNYSLTIPEEIGLIEVSCIGYETQKISVPAAGTYSVNLTPAESMLDAAVVTGYQTIERRKLTAAVTDITISEEKQGAIHSVEEALAGQVAGVSALATSGAPGAPVKIRIRGTASLTGTQEPLWVLDGIPMEGNDIPSMEELKDIDDIYSSSIAGLNPADIESLTVLKDAAATAIYGARAANGVIVITTKKGRKGKPVVNFSTRLTYSPNLDIDRLNLMNSSEKVGLELDLLRTGYDYREKNGGVARILTKYGLLDAYKDGGWDGMTGMDPEKVASAKADINRLRTLNTDWNDILFRSTFGQEYNISVSGGTENTTYYSSFGYYDEQGNVRGVSTNRFNTTQKVHYTFNNHFKAGLSLFANQRKSESFLADTDGFTNPVYYSRRVNPYYQAYDSNGNYIYDTDVTGRSDDMQAPFNIYEERSNTSKENLQQSLSAIMDLELRFDERFKLTSQLGVQIDRSTLEKIADGESFASRKERLRSEYLYPDGERRPVLPEGGFRKQTENRSSQITWKAMGEYHDAFRGGHEVEAMLGTEIRKNWADYLFSAGYGYNPRTMETTPVIFPHENFAKSFPLYDVSYNENAFVSFFSTFSYTYKKRYTVGGSVRFDGTDVYGVAKSNRYTPLYSVSALWRPSQEEWLKDVAWIDNWVWRGSFGVQGNIDKNTPSILIGDYRNQTILPGNTEEIIEINNAPNKKLKWEKTYNVNLGTDISVLDDAIRLSIDYYYRKGVDLIGLKMLPLESGFSSLNVNWAEMRNQGLEIALGTRNIRTDRFAWYTNLNLGYNENTVLKETQSVNSSEPTREGLPVSAIFAYKTAGFDADGYPIFVGSNGEHMTPTEFFKLNGAGGTGLTIEEQRDRLTYIGSADPKFTGGFINTFEYDRFTLTLNAIFNFGGYVRTTPSYSNVYYDRGLNTNRDILDRISAANPNGSQPGLLEPDVVPGGDESRKGEYKWFSNVGYAYSNLDIFVKEVNYVRMQSMRLGYKIPESLLNKIGVKTANVAIEGRNLFVISSNYDNYLDPETMGNPFAQPLPKSIIFSLNLTL